MLSWLPSEPAIISAHYRQLSSDIYQSTHLPSPSSSFHHTLMPTPSQHHPSVRLHQSTPSPVPRSPHNDQSMLTQNAFLCPLLLNSHSILITNRKHLIADKVVLIHCEQSRSIVLGRTRLSVSPKMTLESITSIVFGFSTISLGIVTIWQAHTLHRHTPQHHDQGQATGKRSAAL